MWTKMRAVVSTLFLLGALYLSVRVQASILSDVAVEWEGPLPCDRWDCECVFKHQRGCCCAAGQLHELEEQVFLRTIDLWNGLLQLNNTIEEVTGRTTVAFTASMTPRSNCFGPFTSNVPIPYSVISLNYGSGYNPALGAFTAPCAGLYSFSFTAYSQMGSAGRRLYYKVQLMRNGEVMASSWEDNREDSEDSGSQSILLPLERGGQVYVELLSGRQLCGDLKGHNIFSGYLLYPTETRG